MADLEIALEVFNDGDAVPGFPHQTHLTVDDVFAQAVTLESSTPDYASIGYVIPGFTFDDSDGLIRFLLIAPYDQAITVRTVGQTAGGIPIPAGGVACWVGIQLSAVPTILTTATTKVLIAIGRVN